MKIILYSFLFLSILAIVVFGVLDLGFETRNNSESVVEPYTYDDALLTTEAGEEIRITILDTHGDRTRGLSYQPYIEEDEGLLFVFDFSGKHSIWMRDMLFPIDIVWLDESLIVVDVARNVSPDTYRSPTDAEVFFPQEDARFVLELASGAAETYALERGSVLIFGE